MAKGSKASQRKLRASLGDSWDDANYSTDGGASTAGESHSEIELELSDNEAVQDRHVNLSLSPPGKTTMSSTRRKGLSSQSAPEEITTRNMKSSDIERTPRASQPSQSPTQSEQTGPSFIMPKLESSIHSSNGSPSRRSQVRSRNIRNKTPHLRASDRSSTSYTPAASKKARPASSPERPQVPTIMHYIRLFYENFATPVIRYAVGVFGHAMGNLQPFLGLALAVLFLIFGVQWAVGSFRSGLTVALSPICLIPGSSYIVPFCAIGTHDDPRVDFEGLLDAQSGLEEILDASKDTSTLPSTIKDSEIAIRDLRTLVRHSRLPSRHQLDLEFENFVLTANEASVDLSRYNSRIGATMDRIIATNTWTMAVLSGLSEQEASYGALDRVYGALTRPFLAPPPTLQQRVFDQYLLHVSKNKEEITKLIETAVALLSVLQNLDERLDTIYQIAINDDVTITKNQEELLAQLWTKLGGNNAKVKAHNKQLHLLRNISAYRKKALVHVSETLLKLREIQAELENLREGIAAPEILGWRDELPMTYHLDLIEKGVERLRRARGESMRVEGETYRRLVRGSEEGRARELPAPAVTVRTK
ncbi:uncharacterized protein EKO05_0003669 [Ascochyta rabiei]|uniref:Uncharacterized protein n=1 Tax=Didymella rabiei TaxID=5454 RepID=A0A162YWM5_DIDRA|nr:uncharacterized protein EKO05_0003669 [Ascochyta rabiei]KZM20270.1 hypothetical protein ST47_g8599 [Ascochyta rabiei]UPX13143.1 hypothetical protein EKO05_0003669 [Ascochyta rabiei]